MPKILRILNRFNLGGPTYNAAYLTKYLEPEFETLLVGGMNDVSESNSEYIVNSLGIKPLVIKEMNRSLNLGRDYIAYRKLLALMKEFKPDIVHTHASKAGALGRMAAHRMKVPVIIHTFHGHVFDAYFGKSKSMFYTRLERYLATKSTKIIAISNIQKDDLANKFHICNEDKIEVIPLGFDFTRFTENAGEKRTRFRAKYTIDDDTVVVGIVGRLVPVKNHTLFIDAISVIKEKTDKKVRFFIAGDGEERENVINQLKQLNIDYCYEPDGLKDTTVVLTSWVKDVDIFNAGMDIIALTSLNEGTPVSLIEAQASRKPIVTTRVGGISDVVIPNETALLSESGDLEMFSNLVLRLIEDPEFRMKLSDKGFDFVKDRFSYTRLSHDMSRLYHTLLEQRKRPL